MDFNRFEKEKEAESFNIAETFVTFTTLDIVFEFIGEDFVLALQTEANILDRTDFILAINTNDKYSWVEIRLIEEVKEILPTLSDFGYTTFAVNCYDENFDLSKVQI